mgnify:CR=1 FL=1
MRAILLPLAAAALLATSPAPAGAADDNKAVICKVTNAVSNKDQLKERLKRCKANDVLVLPVVVASVPLTEIAGRVCDLRNQVLLEPTTEVAGNGRITCLFTGIIRDRNR